jgi:hypothetical protein
VKRPTIIFTEPKMLTLESCRLTLETDMEATK